MALWNRTAQDFVVYEKRDYGINLRWLKDTKRNDPHDWRIEGVFPNIRLKNLTAEKKHDAYVLYGKRDYGINLVWGKKPNPCNFYVETLAATAPQPGPGDYTPGEAVFTASRPRSWMVEWDGREGLDFDAYNTVMRAPFIQDVTRTTATVIWRVGLPKGWDPAVWAGRLKARAWVAAASIRTVDGRLYKTGDPGFPIAARDITGTYKYESGVRHDRPTADGKGASDYWLNRYSDRPVAEFSVTFTGLEPGRTWHYRIESEGVLDEDDRQLTTIVMADDVYFRTAPEGFQGQAVRFVAMGDLGPGDGRPSYFYDVFDLFHGVSREKGPHLWLALGDIDNDTDGHPNAMDPFFFHVYNAYLDKADPRKTAYTKTAKSTAVKAFRNPPYYGLLGGLPAFPTFGNHDICSRPTKVSKADGDFGYWKMAYRQGFRLPSAGWDDASTRFNAGNGGFFYTFRYGNVIFLSLGIPRLEGCKLSNGKSWASEWGNAQEERLRDFLGAIRQEIAKPDVWVVAYLHDHHAAIDFEKAYPQMFLHNGVDLVLAGHQHFFQHRTLTDGNTDYRAVVVGTGGFGDTDPGDDCHRPGFILAEVRGSVLQYWKYDTHRCSAEARPDGRDAFAPAVREYCRLTKTGFGRHDVEGTEG